MLTRRHDARDCADPASVDDDLVPAVAVQAGQIGVGPLTADDARVRPGDHQQPPVGEPVEAERTPAG